MNKSTSVFALGGLDEVGKNTYCIEHEQTLLLIDAGMAFPDADIPGIDYVIPDYIYLVKNQEKIKALVITHGHEDHIGGIPFLLQRVDVPLIYASRISAALIRAKLDDFKVKTKPKIIEIDANYKFQVGDLHISFFQVTHSIPDALGVCVKTPDGVIVHSGDFKVDLTPIGADFDFAKLSRLAADGVDLFLSDSTNAEVEGYSMSEKEVIHAIKDVFRNAPGRLLTATFASNVFRIQQIVEAAVEFKRKIAIFGRSMEKVITIGRQQGYIKCPDDQIISSDQIRNYPANQVLIICTGSQGEPMAALSRIAAGQHKNLKIIPGDTVVFSSSPIPGNTLSIARVVNQLAAAGADVLTNSIFNSLHTTGHASREELKLMLKLVRPRHFMPIHGEYKMQRLHAEIAESVGIKNNYILSNGDRLLLDKGNVSIANERVEVDTIYVEGSDASGQSTAIIRDRKIMSDDGVVAVIIAIDTKTNNIMKYPTIISRGFVYIRERGDLITNAEKLIWNTLTDLMKSRVTFADIKKSIRSVLSTYLFRETHRNPMIVPVICNKKDDNA